jgi:uncharacterized Zn finger protein
MNSIYELLATALDLLTGGSLDYKEPHGPAQSRIDAGLRLLEAGKVAPTDTPGCYLVTSQEGKKEYYVSAVWGDLSCTCEDAMNTKHNPTGICLHQIAAVTYEAMQQVFAQMDAVDAQRSVA